MVLPAQPTGVRPPAQPTGVCPPAQPMGVRPPAYAYTGAYELQWREYAT